MRGGRRRSGARPRRCHNTRDRQLAARGRLLLVLDEFAALGRLPFLEGSLAYLAAHGIKPLLTIPSLTQLNRVYGNGNTLWAQCAIRTVLPVKEFETAAAVAEEIAGIVALADQQASTEQRQQPITPDELMCLGKREAIILGAAEKPIRATTLPYYEDARFKSRAQAGNTDPLMAAADVVVDSNN